MALYVIIIFLLILSTINTIIIFDLKQENEDMRQKFIILRDLQNEYRKWLYDGFTEVYPQNNRKMSVDDKNGGGIQCSPISEVDDIKGDKNANSSES